jgi:hypothetical protein
MRADEITGVNYNLTLNSTQFTQLTTSAYTNGDLEWGRVMQLLNMDGGPGAAQGQIRWNPSIEAGKGLITPVDPTGMYMELIVGQPTRNIIGFVSEIEEISPMIGTTYEILGPRVVFPNAICTLTSI